MVDLETMGRGSRAAIVSIGAIAFDPWSAELLASEPYGDNTFYLRVDLRLQPEREFDGDTILWWLRQSDEARRALGVGDQVSPQHVCRVWDEWLFNNQVDTLWCYGASFDFPILSSFWEQYRDRQLKRGLFRADPVTYKRRFDLRTLAAFIPRDLWPTREGIAHNAFHDAAHQAKLLRVCVEHLRLPRG